MGRGINPEQRLRRISERPREAIWSRPGRRGTAQTGIAATKIEPDPAEMTARYGVETPVPDCPERLVCSKCGSRQVDVVVGLSGPANS